MFCAFQSDEHLYKKKTSDFIQEGDIVAYIHANNEELGKQKVDELLNVYEIVDEKVEKTNCIIDVICWYNQKTVDFCNTILIDFLQTKIYNKKCRGTKAMLHIAVNNE